MSAIVRVCTIASVCFLFACTSSEAPVELDNSDRAPLGKRDHFGTCEGTSCDGASPDGSCYCDELCTSYGDCCDDKVEVCDAPTATICGGFAGFTCDADEFCAFEASATCGFADATGTCVKRPEVCTAVVLEVCGCDGQTYSNSCIAANSGTGVLHDGACADNTGADSSCEGNCGDKADNCYCDDACEGYGDCCDDVSDFCAADDRTPLSGQCLRNLNTCTTDADCAVGGCGGELCFNPAFGNGITTCDCGSPTNVGGCGCVDGSCTWYE